jgi:hypothetical protein
MIVTFSTSGLKLTSWREYLIRFGMGGLVTAGAGVLADKFGPSFGGLFLGFPAILAASATLVDKHERERKAAAGLHGSCRGRLVAAADSAGATMGSIGLTSFAWFVWKLMPDHNPWLVVLGATLVFAIVSVSVWWIWRRYLPRRLREAAFKSSHNQRS